MNRWKRSRLNRSKNKLVGIPVSSLLPGDILLFARDPQYPNQKWISRVSNSPYTHAAIYLGGNLVAESTPLKVRTVPIGRLLKSEVRIGVLRNQAGFNGDRPDKLRGFILELIKNKTRYDFKGALQYKKNRNNFVNNQLDIIRNHYNQQENAKEFIKRPYFCSGLVVACLAVVGIIGSSAQIIYSPDIFSPADLHNDPTIGWFLGYIHFENHKIPNDDPLRVITNWESNMAAQWW